MKTYTYITTVISLVLGVSVVFANTAETDFQYRFTGEDDSMIRSVNAAVIPLDRVTIESISDLREHTKLVLDGIKILEGYTTTQLRTHPLYGKVGNVYMYYGTVVRKTNLDRAIYAYEKALTLRKEPDSLLRLALCYKEKYDEVLDEMEREGETVEALQKERQYGQHVYRLMNDFIIYTKTTREVWLELRDFFKLYTDY